MERTRRRVHPPHRTPRSLRPDAGPPPRTRSAAVWGTAGGGVACVVLGVLLAVGPPSRGTDVGIEPAAMRASAEVSASGGGRGAPAGGAVAGGAGPGVASAGPAVPGGGPSAADPAPPGIVPVAIELPGHGVGAPVVPTATGPDGALAVPDPPSTVGWWSPGALAGAAAGTTVLVGHVDSAASGLGVFAVLRDVAVGERVQLRGADGRLLGYRVTGRRQAGKAALPPDLFAPGGPPRLALVTCGGRFDSALHRQRRRLRGAGLIRVGARFVCVPPTGAGPTALRQAWHPGTP